MSSLGERGGATLDLEAVRIRTSQSLLDVGALLNEVEALRADLTAAQATQQGLLAALDRRDPEKLGEPTHEQNSRCFVCTDWMRKAERAEVALDNACVIIRKAELLLRRGLPGQAHKVLKEAEGTFHA